MSRAVIDTTGAFPHPGSTPILRPVQLRSPHPASLPLNQQHDSNSTSSDGYVLSPTHSDPDTLVIDTRGTDPYGALTDALYSPHGYRPPGPMERAYQAGRVLVEGIGAAASRTADGVGRGEGVVAGWRMAWGAVRRSVVKEVAVLERWSVWVYGRAASGGAETEAAKADGDLEEVTRREMMWGPDSALHDEHQGEQETPDDEFQRLPTAAGSGYGEIVSDDEQDPLLMSLHSLAPQPHHHTTEKHRFREALETNMTAEEVSALLVRMRHSEAYGEGDDF